MTSARQGSDEETVCNTNGRDDARDTSLLLYPPEQAPQDLKAVWTNELAFLEAMGFTDKEVLIPLLERRVSNCQVN